LMKAYGSSAGPRSYEVWYTYVGGQKPLMNDAIKRLSVERGNISDEDITAIYDAHLATHRHIVEAEKTSASVIAEIDEVMDMIGLALGSTAKYGHLTGDQVLKLVGMTMREAVKSKATLARFGGEEFAIILPETTMQPARALADTIRQSVMSRELVKRSTGESLGKVTISAGVAVLREGDTAVSLLERADQCMYMGKRMGRNRTVTDHEYAGPGDLPEVA
ncbi:MAG: GGDEF domain-containing protein, partial [Microvirga sp.]